MVSYSSCRARRNYQGDSASAILAQRGRQTEKSSSWPARHYLPPLIQ
jgi:hypothetical protein